MPGNAFDSNILLYLVADDRAKAARARFLVADGGTISVQVLNEIANVGRRKFQLSWDTLRRFLHRMTTRLMVVPIDVTTHSLAIEVAERYRLAFYDAAIVAAALLADCDTLWSEDMHHGLVIDGRLTIRNPFAA